MTNFKGDYITRDDVKIAKNYLSELEFQALEQNPMTMQDWIDTNVLISALLFPSERMKSLVSKSVLEVKDTFENLRSCTIKNFGVNGITVKRKLFASDEKNRYLHIYYSVGKCASERAYIYQRDR